MKKVFFIFYFLFFVFYSKSQNFIPNGDFEFYTSCPSSIGNPISLAFPWYDPTGATSDYYNACANPDITGVPNQGGIGYQFARSGNGYSGFFGGQSPGTNYREYIQIKFTDSLIFNNCYWVSFYLNLFNNQKYAINNNGAYISNTPVTTAPPNVLNYNPQILLPGNPLITDTLNWIKVDGLYQANGGEKYITIGNFKDDLNTSFQIIDTSNFSSPAAYYYIDDVSLFEIKNADAGKDSIICNGNSVQLGSTNYEGVVYSWQPAVGLSNANIGNPIANPTQTTTYYLTQTTPCAVTTDSVTITVCDLPPPSGIIIPNIFTPNNDGINDVFKITTKNIITLNCKIYNRWGILVSELTKINEAWDGLTTSGLQCANGVYYYVIIARGEDGKEYNEKGFVSLVR